MENLPNISINLIVKNEEKRIAQAINSIKPIASEIVVPEWGVKYITTLGTIILVTCVI